MNEVFIIGKVINIRFEFIYGSKNISICFIEVLIEKENIVNMYGYNELADYMIQELNKDDIIFINGKLRDDGKIDIRNIIKINNKYKNNKDNYLKIYKKIIL